MPTLNLVRCESIGGNIPHGLSEDCIGPVAVSDESETVTMSPAEVPGPVMTLPEPRHPYIGPPLTMGEIAVGADYVLTGEAGDLQAIRLYVGESMMAGSTIERFQLFRASRVDRTRGRVWLRRPDSVDNAGDLAMWVNPGHLSTHAVTYSEAGRYIVIAPQEWLDGIYVDASVASPGMPTSARPVPAWAEGDTHSPRGNNEQVMFLDNDQWIPSSWLRPVREDDSVPLYDVGEVYALTDDADRLNNLGLNGEGNTLVRITNRGRGVMPRVDVDRVLTPMPTSYSWTVTARDLRQLTANEQALLDARKALEDQQQERQQALEDIGHRLAVFANEYLGLDSYASRRLNMMLDGTGVRAEFRETEVRFRSTRRVRVRVADPNNVAMVRQVLDDGASYIEEPDYELLPMES